MKYLLYGHGGSGNLGCEAIVGATARMLRAADEEAQIILSSRRKQEDKNNTFLCVDNVIDEFDSYHSKYKSDN